MTFDIPDRPAADFPAQARLFSNDLQAMVQPASLTGVKTGCAVTAQSVPNMTLAVALGTVYFIGVEVGVTAGNVTITTAHGTQPRFDIVVVDSFGVKSVVAGTAAEFPVEPLTPANSVMLAQVYVPALDTAIGPTQIRDRRILVQMPTIVTPKDVSYYKGRTSTAGFESWYLAGQLEPAPAPSTFGDPGGPNSLIAMPYMSGRGGTLDRISFRVQTASAARSGRVAIYDSLVSDVDFYPRSLIVDGGDQSMATTGNKTSTINVTLQPNKIYWFVMNHNAPVNTTFTYTVSTSNSAPLLSDMLGFDVNWTGNWVAWKHFFNYAAMPATFPDTARTLSGAGPAIGVRYSA